MTEQKNAILTYLKRTRSHPTAINIFHILRKKFRHLGLGTVYRNLELLKNQDLILEIADSDGVAHFDGYMTSHDHFYCEKCRKIFDLNEHSILKENLRKILGRSKRFKVYSYQLIFFGNCHNCRKPRATRLLRTAKFVV